MTPERKAEIRARLAAATPGPWSLCDGVYAIWGIRADPPQQNSVQVCDAMGLQSAVFIAAAPTDVADLLAEVERLTAQIAAVTRLHRPWGVYGECGHGHTEAGGAVKGIDDIGFTCLHEYDICTECCTDGERFQTEACASGHDHRPGKPICATIAAFEPEPRLKDGSAR